MKRLFFLAAALVGAASAPVFAGPNDVQIAVTRIKLDEQRSRGGNKTKTTKEVAYKVTVSNKTFQNIPELEIKYMLFYKDAQFGSKEDEREQFKTGKEVVSNLEGHKSIIFETKPVELSTETLDGNWYFSSGAANHAKDRVSGLWFRAYANGELVGEYLNPTTIQKRHEWKD